MHVTTPNAHRLVRPQRAEAKLRNRGQRRRKHGMYQAVREESSRANHNKGVIRLPYRRARHQLVVYAEMDDAQLCLEVRTRLHGK